MNPIYDLHTHSTASDGTLTPGLLVRRAAAAGVTVLALTDHDTTEGLAEAGAVARELGIALVPGVEISVTWGARTVHIVGLNLDIGNPVLRTGLAGLMNFRAWRAEEIGRRLAKHGIAQAYEGAKALSNGILIGRTHFARFLVHRRLAADTGDVFKRFLTNGKPGYVAGQWATLDAAVGWIRAAGGQAVVAHPARYGLTRTRVQALLGEFREHGGVALEVVTGSHSRDDAFTFARHAREQRLLASAGSDFHGPENPWLELGRLPTLPEGCTPIWHDWRHLASDSDPALANPGASRTALGG
ncbi:phosphatase [Thiocystis minor]|uniref:PHP domain-containing protein n=1 Tax=Thiocystis minor TaxID=61597 RepID=UPI001913F227|nr:PHP domain-containing protein [Thiocystis minor]MBK5964643.1 phosphatase [Thiocystis minor]